jgi:acyl-CoA synthetase (NDP forming)
MDENIRYMFHPRSIAIIGASNKLWKVGHAVIANVLYGDCLRRDRTLGYKGKIYPVNPNEDNVFNLKCYPDVLSIPDEVDLAVVAVPAKFVPGVIEQCGQKGVKTTIIISAGFGETGDEGKRVEAEIVATARKYGMRILGPNCLGIYSLYEDLNTTFARAMPMKGPISFISQSGAFCASVIQYALEEHFGFSNFVSIGNKSDIDDADIIEYFATDEHTKCIGMYI